MFTSKALYVLFFRFILSDQKYEIIHVTFEPYILFLTSATFSFLLAVINFFRGFVINN